MSEKNRILVVDDEAPVRRVLEEMLRSLDYAVLEAEDGAQTLALALHQQPDLILLDVGLPDLSGFEVAKLIRGRFDPTVLPIIIVTGRDRREERLKAVEAGANDFIGKPVDVTELKVRVAAQLRLKEAERLRRRHRAELERAVRERTQELLATLRRLREAQMETLFRLALAAEYKDDETGEHIQRVGSYCGILAAAAGLPAHQVHLLEVAGPMHDVGKIGIPDAILLKPGKLDPGEWEIMKTHTSIGHQLLSGSESEYLEVGASVALTHHERWDGAGYPQGLATEEIPIEGRICAIADVFDALTSERPYRPAFPVEQAVDMLRAGRGSQFDPGLLDLFIENLDRILSAKQKTQQGDLNER
jgi:putative two-component system response regulator